ncbi:MAG: hypothetical protein HY591_05485 [Candidatus Omnitrophica bacterium]|nr:hypothetical protein [Candidatus Omnitrophota bacterium]
MSIAADAAVLAGLNKDKLIEIASNIVPDRAMTGDLIFEKIARKAARINPQVDLKALYGLYHSPRTNTVRQISSQHKELARFELESVNYKFDTYEESLAVPNMERRIDHDPMLDILKSNLRIPKAYMIEKSETFKQIDGVDHWGKGYRRWDLFVSLEDENFVDFYLSNEDAVLKILFGEIFDVKTKLKSGVRQIGKGRYTPQMGNKEAGFLIFERMGLRYPPGIALSDELVKAIAERTRKDVRPVIALIEEELRRIGIDFNRSSVSVRSNPKRSMPGILKTVSDTRMSSSAIREVAQAWYSDRARAFRRREGIGETYDLPVIIQLWISGEKKHYNAFQLWVKDYRYKVKRAADPSLSFYGAGVFSTRDPNTNERSMFGQYIENANGEELMTGGQKGEDINKLAHAAPDVHQQILDAVRKLEKEAGPQEVEFVVNEGTVYFTQTRMVSFSPQAEIAYLREQIAQGKITERVPYPSWKDCSVDWDPESFIKLKKELCSRPLPKAGRQHRGPLGANWCGI